MQEIENKQSLIIDLLTEIHTQNRLLAEMVLPLYCQYKKLDSDIARELLNNFFTAKKAEKEDVNYANHGKINMDDILK